MKRWIWAFAALLIATPLFAQDEGGGGGLPSSLFGGGDFGATRGEQANPMIAIKAFFTKANVTIAGDQEKAIKPIVDAAFKLVQDTVEKMTPPAAAGDRGGRGQGGQGAQVGQSAQAGQGRGGGGGNFEGRGGRGGRGGGEGVNVAANPQLAAALQKINDEVLTKIVAALKPDQQAAFKKWQNDEIKKGGGYAALKIQMQDAGAPLTAEQEPQIRTLYVEDQQQRAQLQREAQGRPDPAKVAELEKATLAKVVKVLTAAQRKALLDSRAKQ